MRLVRWPSLRNSERFWKNRGGRGLGGRVVLLQFPQGGKGTMQFLDVRTNRKKVKEERRLRVRPQAMGMTPGD